MSHLHDHGEWIWLQINKQGEFNIPVGGRILRTDKGKTLIRDDEGVELWITNEQIVKGMHLTSQRGVEDMITLGDLQEYAILRNLYKRYTEKLIYTYTGSMLVAINPYEILPIYTNNEVTLYRHKKIGDLPPHIFAIGDSAYQEMRKDNKDQCIVISGESGAGKTESTKLILQYLASISGKHSWIEQQIIDANPIMEAFGNAKTVRNDNSSRFGKYIDIYFNTTGAIEGAKIEQYLLEKSRIVGQNKGERNYHIFYAMLAGLTRDEKKKLELEDASKYNYLIGGQTLVCDGRNDANEFADIKAAMKVLSFSDDEIWDILKLLAALLHLGNIKYKAIVVQNIDATEVNDNINSSKVATLLGVIKSSLCDALTRKTIFAHGERVVSSLSKENALEARDAFVKAIYGKIFIMIVNKINNTIFKSKTTQHTSIGVLDIFGFENFTLNSFEQLCINYANENLQQFFVKHIFKMEQEEYTKEGICWKHIAFVDNQDILDMVGLKPVNIMSLIDEESKFPKGTDLTMLSKLHATHSTKSIYLKPKSDTTSSFGIQHFAGTVFYDVAGFLEKNRDSFSTDLKELILHSTNQFLLGLFSDEKTVDTNKKSVTLSTQFRVSLDALMKTLSACHPFFIRCIKPNEYKKSNSFDKTLCVRQLRYSGMMETAKIRRAGYPIRHTYLEFVERYRHLGTGIGPAHKVDCKKASSQICSNVLRDSADYQFGNTKIFLKDSHDIILEAERSRIYLKYIVILQRGFRRVIFKRWIKKIRWAAITLQKHFRARGYRENYLIMQSGFKRLQASIMSRQLAYRFSVIRKNMVSLQAFCRGYIVRKNMRGKIAEKTQRMQELMVLRRKEEQDFKKSGSRTWREDAESNYMARVAAVSQEFVIEKEEPKPEIIENHKINIEDDNKVVDDVFGFLDSTSPEPQPKYRNSYGLEETPEQIRINNKMNEEILKKKREELAEYTFAKFAATYFANSSVTYEYSKRHLRSSLLDLPLPYDQIAAQAIWITILRFMGDMAEAKYEDDEEDNTRRVSVMHKLNNTIGRNSVKPTDYKEAHRKKLINHTLKKKTKLSEDLIKAIENNEEMSIYQDWLSTRSSHLEKLHFIIGHGILRPYLRDEIFAQICKQLTNNPHSTSHAKGWVLLSLCIGCFPPSQRSEKYLRKFICDGPTLYAPYCEERLIRTLRNGVRNQPPSWLELHATKTKTPIVVNVVLMNGVTKQLAIDSATTAAEMCKQLAHATNLKDAFGFSIFITLFDKVMSLGSGRDHVMDAISNCEQYAKEQGSNERKAPWRICWRKEIFAPWHNPADDPVSTDLIYCQVVKGVTYGEYRCKNEKDIAMLAALQYFAEYGLQLEIGILRKMLPEYIPKDLTLAGEKSLDQWERQVLEAFNRSKTIAENPPKIAAKEDIVIYAQYNWPMMFSRFFECVRISGPQLPTNNVIIAVNWTGVFFVNESENVLLELSFAEILSIVLEKGDDDEIDSFALNTVQREDFAFKSYDSDGICRLVEYILKEMKRRSLYAVALQNYSNTENSEQYLKLTKGDLIILDSMNNGEVVLSNETTWAQGECNGKTGSFPTDIVYVLPCILQPPLKSVLKLFKESAVKPRKFAAPNYNTLQRQRMHNLKKYGTEHFRQSVSTNYISSTMNAIRRQNIEELWHHTREPIKAPLLQKLQKQKELSDQAIAMFTFILKYMGDLPRSRTAINTDLIFGPAIKNELLRDELYCQIMRQLTDNRIQISEDRGWDLMWLATGIILPGSTLLKELQEFLKTRKNDISAECLQRIQKQIKNGQRKYPPYIIEVEAIRHRTIQIYHKIYFPDDTDEAFEIESSTRAKDLCLEIAHRLKLKSNEGFSLFVKIIDKAFSVPEDQFIFDFIYELVDWMKETAPSRINDSQMHCQYQLFFMKKMWINNVPGKDPLADQIFYFPQEVPKYLNCYYKITKPDAIKLGALLYHIEFGNNSMHLRQRMAELLPKLIPEDVIGLQKIDDWRKSLLSAHNTYIDKEAEEAKLEFLKIIEQYPTFGSTFFVVKQSTDKNYPTTILIAINRKGFNIIDSVSKDLLVTYGFSDLHFWSSGNTYFTIRFGNMMGPSKLLCETAQGYKMDDLLSSYIKYYKLRN